MALTGGALGDIFFGVLVLTLKVIGAVVAWVIGLMIWGWIRPPLT